MQVVELDPLDTESLQALAEMCPQAIGPGAGGVGALGRNRQAGWERGERSWVTALQLPAARRLRREAPFPGGLLQPFWLLLG